MKDFNKKIIAIQEELNVPKNQKNDFGGYFYRSCEDILEHLKPLLKQHGLRQTISDEMIEVGGRVYVKATVHVTDGENELVGTAAAREAEDKKGMDDSQITGAASSYARKYALNGIWLIDDVKDADTNEHRKKTHRNGKQTSNKAEKEWLNKTEYNSDELTEDWKKVTKALREGLATIDDVFKKFKVNKDLRAELEEIEKGATV